MADAVGYAILPVTLSLRGANAELTKQLVAPAQAAARKASDSVRQQIGSGAEQAAKAVQKARDREEIATRKVKDAEKELKAARDTAEQKAKSVESAELKLQAARSTATSKVNQAEQKLAALRESGTASVEELKAAEQNLETVRATQGAMVIDAENKVSSARSASTAATQKAAGAEDTVTTAKKRAATASQEVISATRAQDAALATSNATTAKTEGIFARLRAKASELSGSLRTAGSSARSSSSDMSAFSASANSRFGEARGASDLFIGSVGRIGGAVAALAGPMAAFAGGWKRATGFQEAEVRFKALGVEGKQFTDTMDMLNNVVKGTSAGLDEASQQASMLMTSGVSGGKQLEDSMSALVTASAVGGKKVSELGMVFQQVSAAGKLQAGDALQLSQASVPIWSWLSKTTGKTVAEVRKMSEEGKISYDDMVAAIKDNGGSLAKDMSNTFSGQVSLLKSSVARMGEVVATPILNLSNKVLPAATVGFDGVGKAIKAAKAWFEQGGVAAEAVKVALIGVGSAVVLGSIIGTVKAVSSMTMVVGLARRAVQMLNLSFLASPLGLVVAGVAAAAAGLTLFFTKTETGRNLWNGFIDVLKSSWEWLSGVFAPVFDWIGEKLELLGAAWSEITAAFSGGDWGTGALSALVGADAADGIVTAVERVGDAFGTVMDVLSQIPALAGGVWDILFGGDFTGLPFGIEEDSGIVDFLFTLRDVAIQVGGFLKESLGSALGDLWGAIKSLAPAVLDMGKALGGAVLDAAIGLWEGISGLWEGVRKLYDALAPVLLPVLKVLGAVLGGAVLAAIVGVVGAIRVFSVVVKAAASVISWLASNVLAPLIGVLGKVASVVGTVLGGAFSVLGTIVGWIADLIGGTLTGIWDGITARWETAFTFISDLFTGLWSGLQSVWDNLGKPVVDFIASAFSDLWDGITLGARLLGATFEVIWTGLGLAWETFGRPVLDFIVSAFTTWWDGIKIIFGWLKSGWDILWTGLQAAWDAVGRPVVDTVVGAFGFWWSGIQRVFSWVQTGWSMLWSAVQAAWNAVGRPIVDFAIAAFERMQRGFKRIFDTIVGFAEGLFTGIRERFDRIAEVVGGIKDRILEAVKGAGRWLFDTGKNIIKGLIDGIVNMGKKLVDKFGKLLPGWVKDPFTEALEIRSPSRVFAGFGRNIGQGLIDGIDAMSGKVAASAQSMADQVATADMPQLAAQAPQPGVQAPVPLATPRGGQGGQGGQGAAVASAGALAAAASSMQATASGVLDPMWAAQNAAVTGFGSTLSATVQGTVVPEFASMAAAMAAAKSGVLDPMFAGVNSTLVSTGATATTQASGVISPQWSMMASVLKNVKAGVIDPTFAGVQSGLTAVGSKFTSAVQSSINPMWSGMGAHLQLVKNTAIIPAFGAVQNGLGTLQGWFSSTVTNIGSAWDRMRAATGRPAKFMVQTVFNDGIRSAWNAIADLIGEKEMRPVGLGHLGGFASGGVLPGYTPGRDVHHFASPTGGRVSLSGGEAIMRPEWTRAVGGPRAVAQMNADARRGRTTAQRRDIERLRKSHEYATGGVLHFARGGVVPAMERIIGQKYPSLVPVFSGYRPSADNHGRGLAGDFSDGTANTPAMNSLARDIAKTYPNSMELIYESPGFTKQIKNGRLVGGGGGSWGFYAGAGNHANHVHWAMNTPPTMPFGGGVFAGGSSGDGGGMVSMTEMVKDMWATEMKKIPKFTGGRGRFGGVPPKFQKTAGDKVRAHAMKKAEQMEAGPAGPGGAGAERWRPYIKRAFAFQGEQATKPRVDALVRQIWTESKGDPNIAQQIVDVNGTGEAAGVGLYQVIPTTWEGYRDRRLSADRRNSWAQHNFAVRYFRDRHNWNMGPGGVGRGHGWKTGGVLPEDLSTLLYDRGGSVAPGITQVVNASGKPEALLTGAQWAAQLKLADGVAGLVREVKAIVPALHTTAESVSALVSGAHRLPVVVSPAGQETAQPVVPVVAAGRADSNEVGRLIGLVERLLARDTSTPAGEIVGVRADTVNITSDKDVNRTLGRGMRRALRKEGVRV